MSKKVPAGDITSYFGRSPSAGSSSSSSAGAIKRRTDDNGFPHEKKVKLSTSEEEDSSTSASADDKRLKDRTNMDESGNISSFAFSSISTDDFKFDPEIATQILAEESERFLKHLSEAGRENVVRVVLVDTMWQLRHALLQKAITIAPKGTDLLSQGCQVVAVGCNKLLRSGGDRANIDLHKAFGPADELGALIRAVYPNKAPEIGKAFCVPIDRDHPVALKFGVKYTVHVLGPNMNPHRLDDLKGDYQKGRALLRDAYRAMFDCFLHLLKSENHEGTDTKSSGAQQSEGGGGPVHGKTNVRQIPAYRAPNRTPPRLPGLSLQPYLTPNAASDYQHFIWFRTEQFVVIYDGYPKGRYHALVIPLGKRINGVRELRPEDLPMVKKLHELGRAIASSLDAKFQIGYHALPSLTPLHLHVVSTDLDSPRLNTKKHWNSFAHPDLFVRADTVEAQLESGTAVKLQDSTDLHEAEQSSPKCSACGLRPTGTQKDVLATLKAHKCVRL